MGFNHYLEDEDDKPYFSVNSLSYYYDKLAQYARLIEGFDQELIKTIRLNEERLKELSTFWDKKMETFDDGVKDLLAEWVDDGTVDHVIDTAIVDKKLEPVNQQLADTSAEIQTIESKKMDKNTTDISITQINKNRGKIDQTYLSDELLQQMAGTTPVNATPANKSITTEKLAEKAVTPETTNFLEADPRNIYDYRTNTPGIRFGSTGAPINDATYSSSAPINVTPGEYTIGFPKASSPGYLVNRVPLYDADGTFVSILSNGSTFSTTTTITVNVPQSGFIRVSPDAAHETELVVSRTEDFAGFYEYHYNASGRIRSTPRLKSVGSGELKNQSVKREHTDFLATGKNMFDKDKALIDTFLGYGGSTTTLAGYGTSDYMPVEKGKSYTLHPVRRYVLMDEGLGTSLFDENTGDNTATRTITPTENGYLLASFSMDNIDRFQVEEGTSATDYEPYGQVIPKLRLTDEQASDVLNRNPQTKAEDITVTKSGETFTLASNFGDSGTIEIETLRRGRDNKLFNFNQTRINGTVIANNTDDVTPIRTFTTVGANHGYTTIAIVNGAHDKTAADLGSQWTDGAETFTLLLVEPNKLTFGNSYTVSDGIVSSVRKLPAAPLTHVSGATNAGEINVSNSTTGQLYPSVGSINIDYVLDGKVIGANGAYTGGELQVRERYNILDYKALIDYARANIGKSYADAVNTIDGVVEMTNVYTFRKGLKCTTHTGIRALKRVRLGRCGILQAIRLNASGYRTTRYMPGVIPKNNFDFAKGVDLDEYDADLIFTHGDSKKAELPPNHYVDWLSNATGRFAGFAMGYIPDKTDTKNAARVTNSPNTWDMRGTDKSYPVALEGVTLEAGNYMSFMGFRNYVAPEEVGDATLITDVVDNGNVYTFADFNAANVTHRDTDAGVIGVDVQTVQTQGVKSNETIDLNGMVLSSTESEAAGVFKRKK